MATKTTEPSGGGFLDSFLTTIERVGNKVPHPAIIFFWLIGLVVAAVGDPELRRLVGDLRGHRSGHPRGRHPDDDRAQPALARRHRASSSTSIVPNFMNFGAVGVIIVAMIGVGVAEESGLIATLVRKIVEIAPRSIFTFIIVMLGVVSSIAADAGYLVLVPLGAAAFHSLGRHPLAGLAAGLLGRRRGLSRQPLRDADRRAARRDDQRRDPARRSRLAR